ncbi:hypothetical protein PA905_47960 [Planktothrix agardhii CCAP 1459/11A]|uniref:Uncharacterized protein n=1 Tax=Planktothrix agardhii CCAP 1459/11A TaxID=282420 RepID=A0A479ZSE4_PLAAG|nr:hypothetical protein [Planktothrix agardhii]GCL34373.1 hypothetical protein PA905_47960 [Planktothrix agardhii CCAP 1459/11A]CAD5939375.1 hypothetical protein NO108_02196 [Planktothrix rubescens]CAH2571592.1 hypothetical protein PRNO82_00990 [Planktothrix rubescens]
MKTLFVNTFYWVALINVADSWHQSVRDYSRNLNNIQLVTTEEVLTETINFFASFPSPMKKAVFQLLTQVVTDSHINVIPQSHESFTFKIAQSEETYQEFKQPPPNPPCTQGLGGREHRRKRLHRLALLHH